MQIKLSQTVGCHDGSTYLISNRTPDGLLVGVGRGKQRLFTRDGKYAGADRKKNISKILD